MRGRGKTERFFPGKETNSLFFPSGSKKGGGNAEAIRRREEDPAVLLACLDQGKDDTCSLERKGEECR